MVPILNIAVLAKSHGNVLPHYSLFSIYLVGALRDRGPYFLLSQESSPVLLVWKNSTLKFLDMVNYSKILKQNISRLSIFIFCEELSVHDKPNPSF